MNMNSNTDISPEVSRYLFWGEMLRIIYNGPDGKIISLQ